MTKAALKNYMRGLVDRFFKILPLWEERSESLPEYLESLKMELIGFNGLIRRLDHDQDYISLVAMLQYLIDNPDTPDRKVKREVFRAISTCNKLSFRYCTEFENFGQQLDNTLPKEVSE